MTEEPKKKPTALTRGEKEAAEHRAKANLWSDEERAELDAGVMAFFYGEDSA